MQDPQNQMPHEGHPHINSDPDLVAVDEFAEMDHMDHSSKD